MPKLPSDRFEQPIHKRPEPNAMRDDLMDMPKVMHTNYSDDETR